jgi:hypothetical protein
MVNHKLPLLACNYWLQPLMNKLFLLLLTGTDHTGITASNSACIVACSLLHCCLAVATSSCYWHTSVVSLFWLDIVHKVLNLFCCVYEYAFYSFIMQHFAVILIFPLCFMFWKRKFLCLCFLCFILKISSFLQDFDHCSLPRILSKALLGLHVFDIS